jgi:D-serine deaminase-like pyridoxal phosphate-dependent protein
VERRTLLRMKLDAVQTPALLLNLDALDRNLATMATLARDGGVALRPHAKTHKSPVIARKQLDLGAVGICTAKIGEAEVMAANGVDNILVTTEAVPRNMERFVALAEKATLSVTVDDAEIAAELGRRAAARGVTLATFVDVNVGQERTGVDAGPTVVPLVEAVCRTRGLLFAGLQGYEGHCQGIRDRDTRRARARECYDRLAETKRLIEARGIAVPTVTTAGTGTARFAIEHGLATEIQPGSYCVMDASYAQVDAAFENALFILASVVSVQRGDTLVVDAGWKAASTDAGVPTIKDHPEASYKEAGDEHGKVVGLAGRHRAGDVVWLVPSHCDTTINLYDKYTLIRDDGSVEGELPIATRGKSA